MSYFQFICFLCLIYSVFQGSFLCLCPGCLVRRRFEHLRFRNCLGFPYLQYYQTPESMKTTTTDQPSAENDRAAHFKSKPAQTCRRCYGSGTTWKPKPTCYPNFRHTAKLTLILDLLDWRSSRKLPRSELAWA